ncbi:hypothetical protein [Rhodococcus erythropolis]|uniref:hypothetical protein n=1 Tax=Rhodococcus erythropolis TaxID=1833 RepID=UPI00038E4C01|nr:hypothetical protein [Rhodococcus erythropolis]EQM30131.1 hypothetical protein N601_29190 [Rhodococcus erythropolis DN1]
MSCSPQYVVDSPRKGYAITSSRPAPPDVAPAIAAATVLGVTVRSLLTDIVAGEVVEIGSAAVFRFVLRTIITRR